MILFEPLRDKPQNADEATLVFDCLIELIESGKKGTKLALAALEEAIRILYGFSEESRLAYEQYRLCLKTGDPIDDPLEWLEGALERTRKRASERAIEQERIIEASDGKPRTSPELEADSTTKPKAIRSRKRMRTAATGPGDGLKRRAAGVTRP